MIALQIAQGKPTDSKQSLIWLECVCVGGGADADSGAPHETESQADSCRK